MIRQVLTAVLLGAATLHSAPAGAAPDHAGIPAVGTVYTLTNDAAGNAVQVGVLVAGQLVPFAAVSTGGTGTGAGLGSQAALALSADGRHLVAVNAGSDEVSLFRAQGPMSLELLDVAATGGQRPTSVAIHQDLVYVLDADSDDVAGFRIAGDALQPLGSAPLSGAGVAAAQVGFDPAGDHLVVTERATNQILVFPVASDGTLGTPTATPSEAPTPFGFVFRRDGTLVVSEANGGQAGLGAVSTYRIRADDGLDTVSGGVATNQTAACWIALPRDGRFAYTTNTGSGTVTGYDLDHAGELTLLDPSGQTGELLPGGAPIDADFGRASKVLFVLDAGNDAVVAFRRDSQGGLELLSTSLSLPDGAAGLVAR